MSLILTQSGVDEDITITTSKKRVKYKVPPFTPLGKAGMSKYKVRGMDTTSIFLGLSPGATWLWWSLVQVKDDNTNVAVLRSAELSKYQQNKVSKAYGELKQANLVKRSKKEHYLINPAAILPYFEHYDAVALKYNNL